MKKTCPVCSTVIAGNAADYARSLKDCVPTDLKAADIVKKFLDLGVVVSCVQTKNLESRDTIPHVCFANGFIDEMFMDLSDFREMVIDVGKDHVLVNPVHQGESFDSLVVSSKSGSEEASPKEKLYARIAFLVFLYDLLDELEGFLIEAGYRDEKVVSNG